MFHISSPQATVIMNQMLWCGIVGWREISLYTKKDFYEVAGIFVHSF